MNKDEVKKFSDLARIEMSDSALSKMAQDIDSILHYVEQIKSAPILSDSKIENSSVRNVILPDGDVNQRGTHKENLLNSAPIREKDYVKTKKVLNNDFDE
jgi:aspartyl/glutamyl-tRNA(Asn/Gln) amidotransferase C subunit